MIFAFYGAIAHLEFNSQMTQATAPGSITMEATPVTPPLISLHIMATK